MLSFYVRVACGDMECTGCVTRIIRCDSKLIIRNKNNTVDLKSGLFNYNKM